ncbi:MAG: hypothetical protein JO210_14470 [Acidobacteriaceae bacterium]|nr:hypothetical protein [Acidobacteriaceae bacterium]
MAPEQEARAEIDELLLAAGWSVRRKLLESCDVHVRVRTVPLFSLRRTAKGDKLSLDLTWLRDESLEDTDNLRDPAVLARRSSRTCRRRWINSL